MKFMLIGLFALAAVTAGAETDHPAWQLALGMFLAFMASLNINVGKSIQKWKVKIFGHGKAMFNQENRRDLVIWLIGLALTASAIPLFTFALKYTTKSSQVSALNGMGMIGLVIFAWAVLKEKIGLQEIGGALLILIGTTIMGYFEKTLAEDQVLNFTGFVGSTGAIFLTFGSLAAFAWKTNRLYGFAMGSMPGICIGIGVILGDMALVQSQGDIVGQLSNPYPYFAVFFGILATVFSQLAFWRARAMIVIPTTNSFVILTPVIIQYFTFGTVLLPVQYLAVAIIIAGVIVLTYTESQDRLEGLVDEEGKPIPKK